MNSQKSNPIRDAIDTDQAGDMFDMINVTIQSRFLFLRTNENGVDSDDSAPRANRPDLFVADVALDIVETAGIRM